jgi:indole-3-glycerol phosphate synthase
MLDRFRRAKQPEIAALRELERSGSLPAPFRGKRPSLAGALTSGPGPAVIAEYKRASPSKGDINLALTPEQAAASYAGAGAAALSVLTEEVYFKGSLDFLARMTTPGLPLLRKDFILDPLQIAATAATPASALLLIARMFPGADELAAMLDAARRAGLEAVVEIFDRDELDLARAAQAEIIQVNNRDLDTLAVDLGVSRALAPAKRLSEVWISASGIQSARDLAEVRHMGFDAALVGTWLMAGDDPGRNLAELAGGG